MTTEKLVDIAGGQYIKVTGIVDSTGAAYTSVNPFPTSSAGLTFPNSAGNNSTVQLSSGATFTGTIESILNQQSAQIEIVCDQAYTLTVEQYIDLAGTQKSGSNVFVMSANEPTNINITLPGNYFRLKVTNNGGSTTTTLVINTTFGIMGGLDNYGNMPVVTPLAIPYTIQQKATGSAVALASKRLVNGLVLTASSSNTGSIMIGPSGVTATDDGTGNGYKLLPGASVALAAANANQIYIIGVSGYAATDFIYVVGN